MAAANTEPPSVETPLTPQQRKFSAGSKIRLYRGHVLGDDTWAKFISYELYSLFLMPLPGAVGFALRAAILPHLLRKAVSPVVGRGVLFRHPGKISLGRNVILDDYSVLDIRHDESSEVVPEIVLEDHVLIGRNSLIVSKNGIIKLSTGVNVSSFCRIATESKIEIGQNTLIAAYAYIGPGNHRRSDDGTPLVETGMVNRGGVKIGKNVWIGAHTTILDGVSIGDGAVVGAHALVRDDVPANTVVGGVPARILKS